ncbi:GNAT family N-acetyltransferase [Maribacter aestuarii]|uniref:GNAT family N-acetyltransferase n=1 Tax=Maribacter aestuarii TaxID=1130723 RepID=UPI00248B9E4D|nr:GNAT family N-acetyltransferase [Maribacter aestuarii]
MKISINIRFAEPKDTEDIISLCLEHADYEQSEYSKEGKKEPLKDALFGTNKKLECIVGESNNEIIAYATYMKQYATWDVEEYIYMDCLFVKEFARGLRIGERLINKIKEEGRAKGIKLIQWQTPDFNTRAIKFYRRIGATSKSKERFFLKI